MLFCGFCYPSQDSLIILSHSSPFVNIFFVVFHTFFMTLFSCTNYCVLNRFHLYISTLIYSNQKRLSVWQAKRRFVYWYLYVFIYIILLNLYIRLFKVFYCADKCRCNKKRINAGQIHPVCADVKSGNFHIANHHTS